LKKEKELHTFKHLLALAIENTLPHFQILTLEEFGKCKSLFGRFARVNGLHLLLSLLRLLLLLLLLLLSHLLLL